MEQMQKMIFNIYEHIQDEKSKNIFASKLLHSLTDDARYMRCIVRESTVGDELKKIIEKNVEKDSVIFGAGELGKWVFDCFGDTTWFAVACFIDSNKEGETYKGLPVISIGKYERLHETLILVCSWVFHEEQCTQLRALGVPEGNIIDVVELMYEVRNTKQYFELQELNVCENEVFIDGGCFDGTNSLQFTKWCGGKFRKIYAFEPDKSNYTICEKELDFLASDERLELINKGLGEKETVFSFSSDGSGSHFMIGGEEIVEAVSLDAIIKEKITFLKLDIEGAESMAIHGAESHIRKDSPKCAICVYHKPEDIWQIPSLLLEYNPGYRLFLRHYSLNENETVLYAI